MIENQIYKVNAEGKMFFFRKNTFFLYRVLFFDELLKFI